jgi:hypothetical protein
MFVISSCGHEEATKNTGILNSYELTVQSDTINMVYNGLKQGMWIEKHEGKKDTVYYRNDTLINR